MVEKNQGAHFFWCLSICKFLKTLVPFFKKSLNLLRVVVIIFVNFAVCVGFFLEEGFSIKVIQIRDIHGDADVVVEFLLFYIRSNDF